MAPPTSDSTATAAVLGIDGFARAARALRPPPAYRIALDSGVGFRNVRRALDHPLGTRLPTWLRIVGSLGLALVGVERGGGRGDDLPGRWCFCASDEEAAPAVGHVLRTRRIWRSWSRREAARHAGVSVAAVASAERGRGDLRRLERLCDSLELELWIALPPGQTSLDALWKERALRCLQQPARYPVLPRSLR